MLSKNWNLVLLPCWWIEICSDGFFAMSRRIREYSPSQTASLCGKKVPHCWWVCMNNLIVQGKVGQKFPGVKFCAHEIPVGEASAALFAVTRSFFSFSLAGWIIGMTEEGKGKWHDFFYVWTSGGLKFYQFRLMLHMRNQQKGWWKLLHVSALLSYVVPNHGKRYSEWTTSSDTLKYLEIHWLVHLCLCPNSWAKNLGAEHLDTTFGNQPQFFELAKVVPSCPRVRKAIAKRYPSYNEMLIKPSCPTRLPSCIRVLRQPSV